MVRLYMFTSTGYVANMKQTASSFSQYSVVAMFLCVFSLATDVCCLLAYVTDSVILSHAVRERAQELRQKKRG